MADKLMQPAWDPLVLAAQLQKIARQSQTLMQRFVSNQPDAIKLGIGDTSSLGFDFFELMTKMMTNPAALASAQIDLFYGCACRKLNPAILVMQSAQDWATKNASGAVDGARDRLFRDRCVRAPL